MNNLTKSGRTKHIQVKLHPKWDRVYRVRRNDSATNEFQNAILCTIYHPGLQTDGDTMKHEEFVVCLPDNHYIPMSVFEGQRDYKMSSIPGDSDMAYAFSKDYEDYLNEHIRPPIQYNSGH